MTQHKDTNVLYSDLGATVVVIHWKRIVNYYNAELSAISKSLPYLLL